MRPSTERPDAPSGSVVARIEVLALGPDLPRHAYTSHLPAPYTTSTLVRVTDVDGGIGLGQFDSDSYGAFDLAPLETLRTIAPRVVGCDPEDREAIWDAMRDHGTAPDMPGVRSAVDIALWDLAARRAGLPLHRLIDPEHGDTDGLPAYASLPTLESPEAYADGVIEHRANGYTAAKIHAWGDPDRDLQAVRAAHTADPDMALIYDAEGCLDRASAERMASALGDMDVRWFEAPLPDLDLEGYRRLVRLGRVPIVPAGDAIWDARLMEEVLRDPPWSAMRFDVTFAGGITSALRQFEVAARFGLDVELTSYGQTLVQAANHHVMLAFGITNYFERAVPEAEFEWGVTTPIRMDADGMVRSRAGDGLGVELDEAAVDAAVLSRFSVER